MLKSSMLLAHLAFHVFGAREYTLLRLLLLTDVCATRIVSLPTILQSLSGLEATRVASHEPTSLLLLLADHCLLV